MRVTADEAREYFVHPSQRLFDLDPQDLPEGLEYWADGPICGVFHMAFWPGVWMGHFGVKPDGWGHIDLCAQRVLAEFSESVQPARIVGWVEKRNAAAVAFVRRIGFDVDGEMDLPSGAVIMFGWGGKWP